MMTRRKWRDARAKRWEGWEKIDDEKEDNRWDERANREDGKER